MRKFINEFKEFAMRGSVMDLAIGIVIGGAFGKIVSSFVSDVLMPPIGVLLGGADFTNLTITLKQAAVENGRMVNDAVTLNYGSFIQVVIDFLIVAFAIFIVIKVMNAAKRKQEIIEKEKKKAKSSKEEQLLTEIRDLLKKRR